MFIERPIRTKAGKPRSLVAGQGINDCPYVTAYTDSQGKRVICPYYATWAGMLKRVYLASQLRRAPTYNGCSVDPDWRVFTKFRAWMEQQDWQGKQLDKDLLVPGNKHYGPTTRLFVPQEINALTVLRGNARGAHPLGVVESTSNGYTYFLAKCSFYGKQKTIGSFKTPQEAEQAYLKAKKDYIKEIAVKQKDPRLVRALEQFSASL